jgi:mercuric reductase
MYKPRHKKPDYFDFDLIVIGSGAGGGVAAHLAIKLGKKVAVIEPEKIGGECPNYGCVPTKALLRAAESYRAAHGEPDIGITTQKAAFNFSKVREWKNTAVARTGTEEGAEYFAHEGIKVIDGYAHFIDPWTVTVGGRRYRAHKFLIATGTVSVVPPIPGLKEVGYMTYREAIDLKNPPDSLFVLGGGAIGCEFSELFSSFGTKLHIADMAPRLIGLEDPEVGELLGALFTQRGINVHAGVKVTRVEATAKQKIVHIEKDGVTQKVKVAEILLASGKAPATDIGLENAGVNYSRSGIGVNKYMQTSCKHIYAAGDVVGPYRFTHTASYQSRIAAHNMFHPRHTVTADYHAVPRCVFTSPEIACVGMTESQLKEKKIVYQHAAIPITLIGRANTSGVKHGFVKVLASQNGTLLGASIVGPRAGEMIHELTLAIQHRMKASAITNTIHAFPTWSEAVRVACQKITVK